MIQCSSINQTKVQKLTGYRNYIELLSDMSFFEILYNIILLPIKALRTTQHLQHSGLTNNISAADRYQLWSKPNVSNLALDRYLY